MPRVDIWDVPESHAIEPVYCGYKKGITDKYEFDKPLGEGGFGSVRVVRHKSNGAEFACKSICKRLDVPNLPPIKQLQHLENIQREVLILRKLRGTLNVVHLEAVYEDDTHVHIVMEYCRGGELFHRMGKRHYSERTVASYMRAVLRTLAQCHSHRILHRDIKPGNFMLLTEAEDAPLKAIDFGLAVFFDPAKLPLTDLGLEGTPWYMAPEVLSAAVEPGSDVWAAGVMAYQLLSGRFPFDDWNNTQAPALSMVWRSIISEEPSFTRSGWQDISQPAKDFCTMLLNKDPRSRPSAREALTHPWLQKGNARQRLQGVQLTQVVQRLQRYNQQNIFKKTVLDMMANELLSRHMARVKEAEEQAATEEAAAAAAAGEDKQQTVASDDAHRPEGQVAAAAMDAAAAAVAAEPRPPHRRSLGDGQAVRLLSGQLAGPEFLRSLSGHLAAQGSPTQQPALPAAAEVPQYLEGSVHRQQQLLRLIPPKRSLDMSPSDAQALKAARAKTVGVRNPPSADGQAGQVSGSRLLLAAAAQRLEGSWHGPSSSRVLGEGSHKGNRVLGTSLGALGGGFLAQGLEGSLHGSQNPEGSLHGSAGWGLDHEGSVHRVQRIGSVKGATSALEALRRARERKSYAEGLASLSGPSGDHQQQQQQPRQEVAAAAAGGSSWMSPVAIPAAGQRSKSLSAAAAAMGEGSYRGPVRDPSSASLWDLQFMANRLAMEGSAHGNAYAHKLLGAAGTHQGRTTSAVATSQSPAALMQQQPRRSSDSQPAMPQYQQQQPTQQQQQQQSPFLAGSKSLLPADVPPNRTSNESLRSGSSMDYNSWLEGTWHGPGATGAAEQLMQRISALDRSWHGQTAFAGKRAGAAAGMSAASKRAAEDRTEFLRFLEAAKRQRQEQRKVARLVLEGSTHGGWSGLRYHQLGQQDNDIDDGQDSDREGFGGTDDSTVDGSTRCSTPAGSMRGSTAALTAAGAATDGGDSLKKGRNFLGKLKKSVKSLIAGSRDAPISASSLSDAAGSSAGGESGMKHVDSLNKLARSSWIPAEDREHIATAAAAAAAAEATQAAAGGGGLADQIVDLQSPECQASLESRRRGQGAYAALMAASSIAQPDTATGEAPAEPGHSTAAAAAAAAEVPASAPSALAAITTSKVKPYWAEGSSLLLQPTPRTTKQQAAAAAAAAQVGEGEQQQQHQQQQQASSVSAAEDAQQAGPKVQWQQQQQHEVLVPPEPEQPSPATASLLPIPLGQQSLLPVPGGSRFAAAAGATGTHAAVPASEPKPQPLRPKSAPKHVGFNLDPSPPTSIPQPQPQQHYFMQLQHQFLLMPQPHHLPQVPEEPEQQQHQPGDMLPRPGGAPNLEPPSGLLPTPGSSVPWKPKPQIDHGLTPTSQTAASIPGNAPQSNADVTSGVVLPVPAHSAPSALPQPPTAPAAAAPVQAEPGAAVQPTPTAAAVSPQQQPAAAPLAISSSSAGTDGQRSASVLEDIQELLDALQYDQHEVLTVEQLQHGLASLGYALEPSEVLEIAKDLGYGIEGLHGVAVSQFAASQLDWEQLQINHRDEWLECVRGAFDALDADKDGRIKPGEILEALRAKLPEAEVNAAIEDVLLEAAADEDEGLDFAAFSLLASVPTTDDVPPLDHYDARLAAAAADVGSVRSGNAALQALRPSG